MHNKINSQAEFVGQPLVHTTLDPQLASRVLDKLLEETQLAIAARDFPVGSVLTVGDTLWASHRNTVISQKRRSLHAERNLLAELDQTALPPGRRILWVTLEPCLRCAQAIQRFGIDEVVYVLDDPFWGGKAILVQAGITVTRLEAGERACLRQLMNFYVLYPELCAGRAFPFVLKALQRHETLGQETQLKAVLIQHLAPYLRPVPGVPQDEVRQGFFAQVNHLTRLILDECTGALSLAFVQNLHRALFPPNYRLHAVGSDGVARETGCGEWRQQVLWSNYTEFSAPAAIEAELTELLSRLAAKVPLLREDALRFVFDFLTIHPFPDANGRMAAILGDVICLNHNLAPLSLDKRNAVFYKALMGNLSRGVSITEQLRLVDAWNMGAVSIRQHGIYEQHPSAYQTYLRRSGEQRYIIKQVLAKLADQGLKPSFVVTDVGAGPGIIADGILHSLSHRAGMAFEYHYLEPSQSYVDYFRHQSAYGSLPQITFHTMPVEDYLLPPSDLILLVQSIQHVANPEETLDETVSALKPGGIALVVVSHPESDELAMLNSLLPLNTSYPRMKECLDRQGIIYEEIVVETTVQITAADRDTPEGDDLLLFYFRQPAQTLAPALKEGFWAGLAEFARDGGVKIKEAFFWITKYGNSET